MQDALDERKSLGMRRCKSAMLARELPPSETAVRRTTERLVFDEDVEQIIIQEVLDRGPPRLRPCKSAAEFPVVDASDKTDSTKLRRRKSFAGGMNVANDLDDDDPCKLRRSESTDLLL